MLNKLKPNLPIIYKLLNDFLFAILIFFVLVMMAEGILSGIISRYIPIYLIATIILLDIFFIALIGKILNLSPAKNLNKKTTTLVLVVGGLFVLNSVLKFSLFLIPAIIAISLVFIYLLYRVLGEEKK